MRLDVESEDVKEMSIVDYLQSRGVSFDKRGGKMFCLSPLSQEKTPSFCVYLNTNSFYDFGSGVGGDIIRLVMEMEGLGFEESLEFLHGGGFDKIDTTRLPAEKKKDFKLERYICTGEKQVRDISKYAFNRGITRNFVHAKFFIRNNGGYLMKPAMGYVHVDLDLKECGIKMRDINPSKGTRFSARGSQMYYIISNTLNIDDSTLLYIVESESSANSLLEYLSIMKIEAVVISFGSWNNIPSRLPDKYESMQNRKIIIDYDGSEEKYQSKIVKFDHFNGEEVKLKLPKGEDINSLYVKGNLFKYKHIIK
jgi:hypothetical protein